MTITKNYHEEAYTELSLEYEDKKYDLKYPVYIPSKGRSDCCLTANLLLDQGISIKIVVESQDYQGYFEVYGDNNLVELITLPDDNRGIAYVRNYIASHAHDLGVDYYWCVDDNIKHFKQRINGKNVKVNPSANFSMIEQYCDKFINIGGASMYHECFAFSKATDLSINNQIFSCMLLKTGLPFEFKHDTIEDTDYNMKILTSGLCTVLFNRLIMSKATTMSMKGGNTEISHSGDKRLQRSLTLINDWPGCFKLGEKKSRVCIKPSRVWKTFKQIPTSNKEGILK